MASPGFGVNASHSRPAGIGSPPLIAVAIPAYRRPQLLLRALESVFRAQPPGVPLAVAVFDNHSPESPAAEVAERFGGRVQVLVNERNLGMHGNWARCRDWGQASGASYWMLLEDDNQLEPGFFAAALAALEREPGADVFFSACTYFDDGGVESPWRMWSVDGGPLRTGRLPDRELLAWVFTCAMRVSSVLVRLAPHLEGLPVFEEDHYANHDVSGYGGLSIAARGLWYDERPLMRYYVNPTSMTSAVALAPGLLFGELLRALRANALALAASGRVPPEAWHSAALHAPVDRLQVAVVATRPMGAEVLSGPHRALTTALVSRAAELALHKRALTSLLGRGFWAAAARTLWWRHGNRRRDPGRDPLSALPAGGGR